MTGGDSLKADLDLTVGLGGQPGREGPLVRGILLVAIAGHPIDRLEHGRAVCDRESR